MKEWIWHTTRAGEAVLSNLDLFLSGAKFRVLCVTALDYTSRVMGYGFSRRERDVVFSILTLGIKINDYYDTGFLDRQAYIGLRRGLRENPPALQVYRLYRSAISRLEKTRPNLDHFQEDRTLRVIDYRERTNLISLAANCAVAFGQRLSDFVDISGDNLRLKVDAPYWFRGLFYTVMALQAVDDVLGWRDDLENGRPTLFTAFIKEKGPGKKSSILLEEELTEARELVCQYLKKANSASPDFVSPINAVVRAVGLLPQAADFL